VLYELPALRPFKAYYTQNAKRGAAGSPQANVSRPFM
jgi:hypothetical protein